MENRIDPPVQAEYEDDNRRARRFEERMRKRMQSETEDAKVTVMGDSRLLVDNWNTKKHGLEFPFEKGHTAVLGPWHFQITVVGKPNGDMGPMVTLRCTGKVRREITGEEANATEEQRAGN